MKLHPLLLPLLPLLASVQCARGETLHLNVLSSASFEGILTQTENALDGDSTAGNGAVHRGVVSLTLTKRGSVSGKIRYNELLSTGSASPAAYKPVVRTFAGLLKPVESDPLKYSFTVSLGIGPNAGRERLVLEADYSGAEPTVTVRILDQVSVNATGNHGLSSQTPSLSSIPNTGLPEGALGRYVLTTESAYLLVQALPSGRLLWNTKMPDYANSGSALAASTPAGEVSAALYESKVSKSSGGFAVNSLLGTLNLLRPQEASSPWKADAGDAILTDGLDWQSSLSASPIPEGSEASAATTVGGTPFRERGLLRLTSDRSCQWIQRDNASPSQAGPDLAGFFSSGPALFTLQDYSRTDAQGSPALYTWNVAYTARGLIATGVPTEGVYPPALSLRLARDRGEITGFYGSNSTSRKPLKGALMLIDGSRLSAEGWVESNNPDNAKLSTWSMQAGAPLPTTPALASAAVAAPTASAPAPSPAAAASTDTVADCLPPLISPPGLIAPPNLIAPPELIKPPDLIAPPALIQPPNLIQPPDLIKPPDLISPPALIAPPNLITPPELISPPGLIAPPELILPPALIAPPPLC